MQKPPFEVPRSADAAAEDLTAELSDQADGYGDSITDVEHRAGELAAAYAPPLSWTAARFAVTEQGRAAFLESSQGCYDEEG